MGEGNIRTEGETRLYIHKSGIRVCKTQIPQQQQNILTRPTLKWTCIWYICHHLNLEIITDGLKYKRTDGRSKRYMSIIWPKSGQKSTSSTLKFVIFKDADPFSTGSATFLCYSRWLKANYGTPNTQGIDLESISNHFTLNNDTVCGARNMSGSASYT